MIFPYLTLADGTEITHTEYNSNDEVKVYIETPDEKDGFHSLECYLPSYRLENVQGYTDEELKKYDAILHNNAHLIILSAKNGGNLSNAYIA